MHLGCTTFSPQETLIQDVFKLMCGDLDGFDIKDILMRVGNAYWEYEPADDVCSQGKHPHIVSCTMELADKKGVSLELGECVLFDDDPKNIEIAGNKGVPAVFLKAKGLTEEEMKEHSEGSEGGGGGNEGGGATMNEVLEGWFAKKVDEKYAVESLASVDPVVDGGAGGDVGGSGSGGGGGGGGGEADAEAGGGILADATRTVEAAQAGASE
jgi:hypothetical protein